MGSDHRQETAAEQEAQAAQEPQTQAAKSTAALTLATLNPAALATLADCELRIERGLKSFIDVGEALATIRDSRLYRRTHATFEDYCAERWNLKRQRAYELMNAAAVVSEFSDDPDPRADQARDPRARGSRTGGSGMNDPRDLASVFGDIFAQDGVVKVGIERTEAALRRNLASFAHAYGWLVEEEVVVPGWGRIDIVIRDGRSNPLLIELKLDLTKPARIRRAFQQTDGYGRWWATEHGEAVDTILAGARIDSTTMASVFRAYPHVGWKTLGGLLAIFADRGDDEARQLRRGRCADRARTVRRLASVHAVALASFPPDPVDDVLGALNLFESITSSTEDVTS